MAWSISVSGTKEEAKAYAAKEADKLMMDNKQCSGAQKSAVLAAIDAAPGTHVSGSVNGDKGRETVDAIITGRTEVKPAKDHPKDWKGDPKDPKDWHGKPDHPAHKPGDKWTDSKDWGKNEVADERYMDSLKDKYDPKADPKDWDKNENKPNPTYPDYRGDPKGWKDPKDYPKKDDPAKWNDSDPVKPEDKPYWPK